MRVQNNIAILKKKKTEFFWESREKNNTRENTLNDAIHEQLLYSTIFSKHILQFIFPPPKTISHLAFR